jgi:hypothetical protein
MDMMMYRSDRWLLLLVLLTTLVVLSTSPPNAHAQGPNRAGLVVRLDDGRTITRCVQFGELAISGQGVLMRSGLEVVAAGQAICDIEGQSGCPAWNCFCRCHPASCLYWSYWHLVGGDWEHSGVGAGEYQVHDGDVEGWSWGASAPPPLIPFYQICFPVVLYFPLVLRP